jgi:hypothetical protein
MTAEAMELFWRASLRSIPAFDLQAWEGLERFSRIAGFIARPPGLSHGLSAPPLLAAKGAVASRLAETSVN